MTPTGVLNERVPQLLRFCTPSCALGQERVARILESDVSISAAGVDVGDGTMMGLPAGDGMFAQTRELAMRLYGASGGALLGDNGTTGNIQVIVKYLELAGITSVLLDRQAHHSTVDALLRAEIGFLYTEPRYNARFEDFEPLDVDEVIGMLRLHQGIQAVILTSPTYGGRHARIDEIAPALAREFPHVLLVIDAAWGAHLPFHPRLPATALEQGADIAVISSHKMGGALQPASICLWNRRIDPNLMMAARDELATTSPSQIVLASIDASLREMERNGVVLLDRSMAMAQAFRARIARDAPAVEVMRGTGAHPVDPLKVTLATAATGMTGLDIARGLLEHDVVVEKAGRCSVTFIFTLQLPDGAATEAAAALVNVISGGGGEPLDLGPDPYRLARSAPALPPRTAQKLARAADCRVPIKRAAGRIAGQRVDVYPPGIPAIVPGHQILPETITHIVDAAAQGAHLVTNGPWTDEILIVPPGR